MSTEEKLLIIDGNSLASRAFYALPLLKTSEGQYTNAVYGFTNMLLRLLEEEKPNYMVVVFDKAAPTFRHEAYKEYKAQRMKSPAEYREQIPMIKELLKAFSIPVFEKEGFEADDLIGTYSKKAEDKKIKTLVVTGDADAFQLISPFTRVLFTRKGISDIDLVDEKVLKEKYGLSPEQVADYKSLKGDVSDNIPGIPGIGDKIALKLLKQFTSLDNILENTDKIKEAKLRKKIEDYREQALMSKGLATIVTDVEDDFKLQECRIGEEQIDYPKLREIFKSLEFKKLLDRLPDDFHGEGDETQYDRREFILVDSGGKLEALVEDLKEVQELVLLLEATNNNPFNAEIVGITLGLSPDNIYFVPLNNHRGNSLPHKEEILQVLKPCLEEKNIRKFCADSKFTMNSLKLEGISLKEIAFDLFIASYLLAPGKPAQSISELTGNFLEYCLPSREEVLGKGVKAKKITEISHEELRDLSCREGAALFELIKALTKGLEEKKLSHLYFDLEIPLIKVLSSMELEGVTVDKDKLLVMSGEIKEKIEKIEEKIYELAGQKFNINSPKQLSFILFEKLNLPVIKKTKTGYSTSAEVLEELAPYHEIVEQILHYRQLVKLHGTYLEGLLGLINSDTGKIHTTFKQNITATGRLSSTDPNLQNIPVRLEEARRIRKVFIPGETDAFLLAADYSQIELRILADISGDSQLINSFRMDEDIHRRTALEIFELPLEQVTSEMRNRAKAVNFGIVYGMSDYGLSQNLGIGRKEASLYIQSYFEKYPGVKEFMETIISGARSDGYVTTLLSRRRYLPDINHRNRNIRSFAERTAINTPIQGSAADLIKMAMIKIYDEITKRNLKTKMLLQVHDELIFEVPSDEVTEVSLMIKENMENIFELKVPLKVDLKIGKNWYDMDKIVI